jgi:hypothetical protein
MADGFVACGHPSCPGRAAQALECPRNRVNSIGPSAGGLASTLAEAIAADLDAWLAVDPVQIAETLRQPLYIAILIDTFRNNANRVTDHAERLVTLTELVRAEPWPPDDLGLDPLGPRTPGCAPATLQSNSSVDWAS